MLADTLRFGTRNHHDRIEQTLGLPDRITSPAEYADLLSKFYGFYLVIEPVLLELLAGVYQFRMLERQKCELLRQDLVALGWTEDAIDTIPLCSDPPTLASIPAALGCLYVLEGSTLGGQVIAAHFRRMLGINVETGGRYFHGYGSQTAAFWRSFKEALSSYPQQDQEQDCILQSARATFESLEAWLSRSPGT